MSSCRKNDLTFIASDLNEKQKVPKFVLEEKSCYFLVT